MNNISNISQIIKIIKYVDINFNVNNDTYRSYHLVSNTLLDVPVKEPIYLGIINSKKNYNVTYDWIHNNVSYPLLVPSIDTTYQALLIPLTIPNEQARIVCDSYNHQSMGQTYILLFDYPLYFKATTIEDLIEKEVLVDVVYTINQDNTYNHELSFNISDVNIIPGTPKDYVINLELYKDLLKTKYIGTIQIEAQISSTVIPGD